MSKRLVRTKDAAVRLGVTDKTVRDWVRTGKISGYRNANARGLLVDLAEATAHQARSGRPWYGSYGKQARIVRVGGDVG